MRSSPAKFVDAIHEYIDAAVEAAREHYAQVVYGAVARISRGADVGPVLQVAEAFASKHHTAEIAADMHAALDLAAQDPAKRAYIRLSSLTKREYQARKAALEEESRRSTQRLSTDRRRAEYRAAKERLEAAQAGATK